MVKQSIKWRRQGKATHRNAKEKLGRAQMRFAKAQHCFATTRKGTETICWQRKSFDMKGNEKEQLSKDWYAKAKLRWAKEQICEDCYGREELAEAMAYLWEDKQSKGDEQK